MVAKFDATYSSAAKLLPENRVIFQVWEHRRGRSDAEVRLKERYNFNRRPATVQRQARLTVS